MVFQIWKQCVTLTFMNVILIPARLIEWVICAWLRKIRDPLLDSILKFHSVMSPDFHWDLFRSNFNWEKSTDKIELNIFVKRIDPFRVFPGLARLDFYENFSFIKHPDSRLYILIFIN
ncbi:MAG: hypothetical protein BWY13_00033 [Euryarchaeota archaeon ADurb.Bin190]|nr:MAG: hypothetical protein BWY13_00033 [Euryarchaeota archaeon ADurb.Bin190]